MLPFDNSYARDLPETYAPWQRRSRAAASRSRRSSSSGTSLRVSDATGTSEVLLGWWNGGR